MYELKVNIKIICRRISVIMHVRLLLLLPVTLTVFLVAKADEPKRLDVEGVIFHLKNNDCGSFTGAGFSIKESIASVMLGETCAKKYLEHISPMVTSDELRTALRPVSDYKMYDLLIQFYRENIELLGEEHSLSVIMDACRDDLEIDRMKEIFDIRYGTLSIYQEQLDRYCNRRN